VLGMPFPLSCVQQFAAAFRAWYLCYAFKKIWVKVEEPLKS
jgi:hypothetical protein